MLLFPIAYKSSDLISMKRINFSLFDQIAAYTEFFFSGLFVGPLSQMQSHRWTTMVGIVLMGVGSILSAFANSPADLYLSVGLIIGLIKLLNYKKLQKFKIKAINTVFGIETFQLEMSIRIWTFSTFYLSLYLGLSGLLNYQPFEKLQLKQIPKFRLFSIIG
jgi:hypothetical protein